MQTFATLFEARETKTELERQHGNAQFHVVMTVNGDRFAVVDVMERFSLPSYDQKNGWVGVAEDE